MLVVSVVFYDLLQVLLVIPSVWKTLACVCSLGCWWYVCAAVLVVPLVFACSFVAAEVFCVLQSFWLTVVPLAFACSVCCS